MMPSLLTQMFIFRVSYRSRKDLRVTNVNVFENPGLCVAGRWWLMCCVLETVVSQRCAVCISESWRRGGEPLMLPKCRFWDLQLGEPCSVTNNV